MTITTSTITTSTITTRTFTTDPNGSTHDACWYTRQQARRGEGVEHG